jgi:NitT/TauT family transport system ATP-binding protein
MDEPFGAVDAKTRVVLQELLLELLQEQECKRTVVFVTHDIDEAILLSDRILFMSDRRIATVIEVPFARPKKRQEIVQTLTYRELRKEIFDLFYEDEGDYIASGI